MPAGARSRMSRRPSRSSEDTGSSNHDTASCAKRSACASACLRVYAPFASTIRRTSGPIACARGLHAPDVGVRVAPDLHLHRADAVRRPAFELLFELRNGVRRKAAAAVHRDDSHARRRAASAARCRAGGPSGPRARHRQLRSPSSRCRGGRDCGSRAPSPTRSRAHPSHRGSARHQRACRGSASPPPRLRTCTPCRIRRPLALRRARASSNPIRTSRRTRGSPSGSGRQMA